MKFALRMLTRSVFCLWLACSMVGCSDHHSASPDRLLSIAGVHAKTGIRVVSTEPAFLFDVTNDNLPFAESGQVVEPIEDLASRQQVLKGLVDALSVYSKESYLRFIESTYIFEKILSHGVEAGGFYGPGYIALSSPSWAEEQGLSYEFSVRAVHHELSSHVLMRYPYIAIDWGALLPEGWTEAESAAAALSYKSKYSLSDGFLTDYAATSIENDFNVMAEFAFSDPEVTRGLAADNLLIAKKLYLLMAVYREFDPQLQKYFSDNGFESVAIQVEATEIKFSAPESLFQGITPTIQR